MPDEQTTGNQETEAGTSEETGQAEGAVSTPEPTTEDHREQPKLYQFKADGKELKVTEEELIKLAQKGVGAERKFNEADQKEKKMRRWQQAQDDLKAAQGGDVEAIRRLPGYPELGVTKEQAEEVIAQLEAGMAEDDKQQGAGNKPLAVEDLPAEVQEVVAHTKKSKQDEILKEIYSNVEARVGADPTLAPALGRKPKARQLLADHVMSLLSKYAQQGVPYNEDTVMRAVQETRQYADDLGLLDVPDSPVSGTPALGRSPSSASALLKQAGEAPSRLPAAEVTQSGDYETNLLKRMQHAQLRHIARGADEQ